MLKISLPFVDLRGKTPMDLLRAYPDRALSLVKAARRSHGLLARTVGVPAYALADKQSHHWLKRNKNPYLYEVETFADIVRAKGIYALNLHYEWSCTTGVYRSAQGVEMLRVLDCPIHTLGREAMLVLQQGRAGDFYNITWPGLSGVFSAMAPERFSAALNKAPMRRYKRGTYATDWARNRMRVHKQVALPPSHLLRQVMETAINYDMAKKMLMHAPLAMPAIFTLAGINQGEGCVIERTESRAEVIELGAGQRVCAGNHFSSVLITDGAGWRPREPDSYGRTKNVMMLHGHELQAEHFEWLHAPVINPHTRVCMVSNAATQRLMVQGYEGMTRATDVFNMPISDMVTGSYEQHAG
jgi:hypothetical protein